MELMILVACEKAIDVQKNYNINLVFYLYAQLTSCKIERSLSLLKLKLALANNIRTEKNWFEFDPNKCLKITSFYTFFEIL